MDLVSILIFVVVAALVWYIFSGYILPLLPPPFRTVAIVLCALVAIVFLLGLIGVGPGVHIR